MWRHETEVKHRLFFRWIPQSPLPRPPSHQSPPGFRLYPSSTTTKYYYLARVYFTTSIVLCSYKQSEEKRIQAVTFSAGIRCDNFLSRFSSSSSDCWASATANLGTGHHAVTSSTSWVFTKANITIHVRKHQLKQVRVNWMIYFRFIFNS